MPTEPIVLPPAFSTHGYDEVALFNKVLTSTQILDIYNQASASYQGDPQDSPGWEEVYGADYPLTEGEIPTMSNGLIRVGPVANQPAVLAIYRYVNQIGYIEAGRIVIETQNTGGGSWIVHTVLSDARVAEWTPQRAVLRYTTTGTNAAARSVNYVTLQHGWTAVRIESYGAATTSGAQMGVGVKFVPATTNTHLVADSAGTVKVSDDAGWNDTTFGSFAASENWVSIIGQPHAFVLAVMRTSVITKLYDDSTIYTGGTRKAVAIHADHGSAASGYCSVHLAASRGSFDAAALAPFEAETYVNAGGTRTTPADGTASGGIAIDDTQAADTADTMVWTVAQTKTVPSGTYDVYTRVRVATGGATVTVKAGSTGTGGNSTTNTSTSTTYVWVRAGTNIQLGNADNALYVRVYRSAGTGTVRLDRVVLVPKSTGGTATPAGQLDGGTNIGQWALADVRMVPELVTR